MLQQRFNNLYEMGANQEFCLRWSSYQEQLTEALRSLLEKELLVDVTLACDGRSLRAHRAILSACSSYFQVRTTSQSVLIFSVYISQDKITLAICISCLLYFSCDVIIH
jgi:hypothetical protein